MRTQSRDTDPDIERRQIEGMRRMTPGQRFAIASSLTRSAFMLSWRNFRHTHSELDDEAITVLWVRLLYGDQLADGLAAYFKQHPDRVPHHGPA